MNWISVEERLPEVAGRYEVKHDGPQPNNGEGVVHYCLSQGWLIPEMIRSFYHVTHWMPLPEPAEAKN